MISCPDKSEGSHITRPKISKLQHSQTTETYLSLLCKQAETQAFHHRHNCRAPPKVRKTASVRRLATKNLVTPLTARSAPDCRHRSRVHDVAETVAILRYFNPEEQNLDPSPVDPGQVGQRSLHIGISVPDEGSQRTHRTPQMNLARLPDDALISKQPRQPRVRTRPARLGLVSRGHGEYANNSICF